DARAAFVAREPEHLRVGRLRFGSHGVVQVGPVEARNVDARLTQCELPHDVLPDAFRGSGCECGDRYVGEARAQPMQLAVFRAEIVTPLRDAMRLVHDQRGNAVGRLQAGHDLALELGLQQTFRGDVQQLQVTTLELGEAPRDLLAIERRVDERRFDAVVLQLAHLILHQRNQRRYDDADAGPKQRRQLKAQRFAATRRHDREDVAAVENVADDRFLPGTEGIEAESLLELGEQRVVHQAKHNLDGQRGSPRNRSTELTNSMDMCAISWGALMLAG